MRAPRLVWKGECVERGANDDILLQICTHARAHTQTNTFAHVGTHALDRGRAEAVLAFGQRQHVGITRAAEGRGYHRSRACLSSLQMQDKNWVRKVPVHVPPPRVAVSPDAIEFDAVPPCSAL